MASASAGTEGSNRSKGSNIWCSLLKTYIHTYIHTNTNVYVYVYFFYLVYCVSCTPRQRRVVMFTLGLLRLLQLGGTVLETPPARQLPFVCVLGFGVPTVGSRPVVVSGYRSGATAQPQVLRYSVDFPCVVWFSATSAPPSATTMPLHRHVSRRSLPDCPKCSLPSYRCHPSATVVASFPARVSTPLPRSECHRPNTDIFFVC